MADVLVGTSIIIFQLRWATFPIWLLSALIVLGMAYNVIGTFTYLKWTYWSLSYEKKN